jgi:micrococcal nuclease
MRKLLAVLLLFTSINSFAQMMPLVDVRCTLVIDGDTFEILWNGVKTRCRIMNIDAPELKQDFGIRSMDTLVKYLDRKIVKIQQTSKTKKFDLYGRMLVNVWSPMYNNRLDILLVATGTVWYDDVNGTYPPSVIAQQNARTERKGLFACDDTPTPAIPPRLFRSMNAKQKLLTRQDCWD